MYYLKFLWIFYRFHVILQHMLELKKLLDRIDITILNAELYSVGTLWNYRNVNNPYSRIYLITDGYAQIKMHNKRYDLVPGFLYLIPCFTTVNMYCPEWFQQYYIHFTSRLQSGLDILSILECNCQADAKKSGIDRSMFDRLLELNPGRELFEYDANKPIYKRVSERASELDKSKTISNILESNALMRLLLSAFFEGCDQSQISHTINGLTRFRDVIEYIRKNFSSPITLQELADIADLNSTYFSNLFSKFMGIAPIQYINRRRIEEAQLLLLSSNESLKSIAMQVGFNDVFYFSRLFKKITNISPSAYRKQHILS
ncbi:MAG: AraC family transcriptional regulator [Phycisphaerales bacterium]